MAYPIEVDETIPTMYPTSEELGSFKKLIAHSIESLQMNGMLKFQMPPDYLSSIDYYFSQTTITTTNVQGTSGRNIKKVQEEIVPRFDPAIWASCSQPFSFPRFSTISDDKSLIDMIRKSNQTQYEPGFSNEALLTHECFFWVNYSKFTPVTGKLSVDNEKISSNILTENLGMQDPINNLVFEDGCRLSSFAVSKPWKIFTEETFDIYYHFYGAPIQWYTIKKGDRDRFISFMRENNTEDATKCNAFFRHHTYLCSPMELANVGIIVKRYLQRSGEIFVFKPGEIYMGFNHGFTITQEQHIENSFIKFDNERTLSTFCSCGLSSHSKEDTYTEMLSKTEEPHTVNNIHELYDLLINHPNTVPINYKNEIISAKDLVQIYQGSSKNDLSDIPNSTPNSTFTSAVPCMITPTPSFEKKGIPDMKLLSHSKEIKDLNTSDDSDFIGKLAEMSPLVNGLAPWNIDLNNLDFLPSTVEQYIPAALIKPELSETSLEIKPIEKFENRANNSIKKETTLEGSKTLKTPSRRVARRITDILKLQKKKFKFKIDRIPVKRRVHLESTYPKEKKFRLEPQPDSSIVLLPCELFLPKEEVEKLEKKLVPFSSTIENIGGVNIYHCDRCDQTYHTQHHLLRHQKSVHSKTKPYCCPRCFKGFKRRDHVTQHLRRKIPCKELSFGNN